MPLSLLIAMGLLAGWCLSLIAKLDKDSRAATAKDVLAFVGAGAGVLAAILTQGEALRYEWAYKLEDILIGQRLTPVLLAMLGGMIVYLFQSPIRSTLGHLRDIALVTAPGKDEKPGDKPFKDQSFPWYVSIGLFVSIVVVATLAFNPQILRHLTILKAGALEADFASGTTAVQRGQLSVLDPNRKSTVVNWATFEFPKDGDARYATYAGNNVDKARFGAATSFFKENLSPVFKALACFDENKLAVPLDTKIRLRRLAARLAERIRADLAAPTSRQPAPKTVASDKPEDTFAKVVRTLGVIAPVCRKTVPTTTAPTSDAPNGPWDPYIIQAVGDLLLLASDRRMREDFLAATATPDYDHSCTKRCETPTAGQLSLAYAVIDSQVQSERPWPFDDMVTKLSDTLRGIDEVLARNRSDPSQNNPETDALFRRNRLIDLTLGLQLFYQRAIAGYSPTPLQRQIWRDWLQEVRGILTLTADVGSAWPPPFDDATRTSWQDAASSIGDDPATIEDAAIGSALSLVLLPLPDGSPSTADCDAARSMFHFAKGTQLVDLIKRDNFDADDQATYKGLLEQIDLRINSECGR